MVSNPSAVHKKDLPVEGEVLGISAGGDIGRVSMQSLVHLLEHEGASNGVQSFRDGAG